MANPEKRCEYLAFCQGNNPVPSCSCLIRRKKQRRVQGLTQELQIWAFQIWEFLHLEPTPWRSKFVVEVRKFYEKHTHTYIYIYVRVFVWAYYSNDNLRCNTAIDDCISMKPPSSRSNIQGLLRYCSPLFPGNWDHPNWMPLSAGVASQLPTLTHYTIVNRLFFMHILVYMCMWFLHVCKIRVHIMYVYAYVHTQYGICIHMHVLTYV